MHSATAEATRAALNDRLMGDLSQEQQRYDRRAAGYPDRED
jgi:hypothetical protein